MANSNDPNLNRNNDVDAERDGYINTIAILAVIIVAIFALFIFLYFQYRTPVIVPVAAPIAQTVMTPSTTTQSIATPAGTQTVVVPSVTQTTISPAGTTQTVTTPTNTQTISPPAQANP